MGNTITLSVSPADLAYLEENPTLSPTKIFRSAIRLDKSRSEFYFLDLFDIYDYAISLREMMEKITILQKEIERRVERIESLQDVLAQKELAERRLYKANKTDNGFTQPVPINES